MSTPVESTDSDAATAYDTPLGITNPPIDELLDRASSKYALVIYAAKRARQINDYYNQLGDGILEYVGPLVEPGLQEKALSIALREVNAGLLTCTDIDGVITVAAATLLGCWTKASETAAPGVTATVG